MGSDRLLAAAAGDTQCDSPGYWARGGDSSARGDKG